MELLKSMAQSIRKEPRLNWRTSLALSAIALLGFVACNLANVKATTPQAQILTPNITETATPVSSFISNKATAEANIAARATQIVAAATVQSTNPEILSRLPEVCKSSGVALRVFGEFEDGSPYLNGGSGSLVFREKIKGTDIERYFFLTSYHSVSLFPPEILPENLPITEMTVSVWEQEKKVITDVDLRFSGFYPLRGINGKQSGLAVIVAKSKTGGIFLPKFVKPVGVGKLKGWKNDSWETIFVVHNPSGANVEAMVVTEVDPRSVDESEGYKVEVRPLSQVGNPTVTFGSSGAPVCVTSKNNITGAQVGVVQEALNFEDQSSFQFEPFQEGIADRVQAVIEIERGK